MLSAWQKVTTEEWRSRVPQQTISRLLHIALFDLFTVYEETFSSCVSLLCVQTANCTQYDDRIRVLSDEIGAKDAEIERLLAALRTAREVSNLNNFLTIKRFEEICHWEVMWHTLTAFR
jgi:hypothetical protein